MKLPLVFAAHCRHKKISNTKKKSVGVRTVAGYPELLESLGNPTLLTTSRVQINYARYQREENLV